MLNYYWNDGYASAVWHRIVEFLNGNEIGAAAWLGNMCYESSVCPFRWENTSIDTSYNYTINTMRVGTYDKDTFVNDHPFGTSAQKGYSLMQWTYETRKEMYYDYCGQSNLGDTEASLDYLIWEMDNHYTTARDYLRSATDIFIATEWLMNDYYIRSETTHLADRQQMAINAYEDFSGSPPPPPPLELPYWLLFKFKHLL